MDKLVNHREYIVETESGTSILYFLNGKFYSGDFDSYGLEQANVKSYKKGPNYDSIIFIHGTYGDPVILHLNGYINSKYGDFDKVINVDIEEGTVTTYNDSFDFSRISCSSPNTEETRDYYLKMIKSELYNKGLRIGSKLRIKDKELEITNIKYPDLDNDIFDTVITLEDNSEHFYHKLHDFEITYVPYSLEEKVDKIISNNVNFSNEIKDRDILVKELIEFFK